MPDGIYRSVDQAVTWQKQLEGLAFSVLTINPNNPSHIFVGGTLDGSMGIMVVDDAVRRTADLVIPDTLSGQVQAVAVNPLDDQTIYVGGYYSPDVTPYRNPALFKTTNGGSTWQNIGEPILRMDTRVAGMTIEVDPFNPDIVYVRAANYLYKSEDAGATWQNISPPQAITAFRINPEAPNEIYASSGQDIVLSEDGGRTWISIGEGLRFPEVVSIDIVPSVKMVFAGTKGGGLVSNRLLPLYAVSIVAGPGGTTDPSPGVYQYEDGATMNVTAVPQTGYAFKDWSRDRPGTANPLAITVDADLLVRANFKLAAPTGFSVVRQEARSLLMVQYIDILSWTRIAGVPGVAGYRIYVMNGTTPTLLDEVGASVSAYWRRGVAKTGTYRYGLAAVGSDGVEGEIAWLGTTNLMKSRGPLDKGLGATRKVAERIRRR